MVRQIVVTFAVLVTLTATAPADSQSPSRQKPTRLTEFSNIKTFRCDFTQSEGRRTTAAGVTSPATRETFNDLVVDNIDYQKRTARFIGNAGSETVQVIDGEKIVSFLELSLTGNPNLLSIFKDAGKINAYEAVYSRHTAWATGDLTRSQSYGTCRGLV